MVPNAGMYYAATVQTPKEKFLNKCINFQIETSNRRDEESAAQIRLPAMPAHVAIQRSGVPACGAAKTILV
jgi:hypothetical protein